MREFLHRAHMQKMHLFFLLWLSIHALPLFHLDWTARDLNISSTSNVAKGFIINITDAEWHSHTFFSTCQSMWSLLFFPFAHNSCFLWNVFYFFNLLTLFTSLFNHSNFLTLLIFSDLFFFLSNLFLVSNIVF